MLRKVSKRTASSVSTATIESLKIYPGSVLSITADNGSEFAYHENISKELNTDFYFAHPYSSWERGLNENTNCLICQYLKKGSCFANVTDFDLDIIADQLNNRPRKCLGFATPNEIFLSASLEETEHIHGRHEQFVSCFQPRDSVQLL